MVLELRLLGALSCLAPGSFVVVEVDTGRGLDPDPYAQASREGEGWYCELVSQDFLPATAWPIDEVALRRSGWAPPLEAPGNWWRSADDAERCVRLLLSGLREGRACEDPEAYRWRTGRFPPGPDGGLPLVEFDQATLLAA